jgi:hypothetical protein
MAPLLSQILFITKRFVANLVEHLLLSASYDDESAFEIAELLS